MFIINHATHLDPCPKIATTASRALPRPTVTAHNSPLAKNILQSLHSMSPTICPYYWCRLSPGSNALTNNQLSHPPHCYLF